MNKDVFRKLRQMLMEELDLSRELSDKEILDVIDELILNQIKDVRLALKEKVQLRQELFYSVRKLDVLQELVDDETVTEIMVNGPDTIFVERAGKLMKWHKSFTKKQQIGELIGVVAAGLAIGGVLYLLNTAWGYGSAEVPAPQATLMKMIVEGIMGGKLPWTLVFIGVFLAIGLEILRIPVMPFAIGLYLPIYLNAAIMIGGVVRMFVDGRKNVDDKKKEEQATDGTLYCAGMIAGEGLVGILLAILAVVNVSSVFDLSGSINLGNAGGVILMLLMILSLLKFSIWNKKKA